MTKSVKSRSFHFLLWTRKVFNTSQHHTRIAYTKHLQVSITPGQHILNIYKLKSHQDSTYQTFTSQHHTRIAYTKHLQVNIAQDCIYQTFTSQHHHTRIAYTNHLQVSITPGQHIPNTYKLASHQDIIYQTYRQEYKYLLQFIIIHHIIRSISP